MLNSDKAQTAIFHIEKKLRELAEREKSLRSIAIFDCCSVPITNYQALWEEVGGRATKISKIEDPDDSNTDETGQHWQIVTAKPGGIAGANVGNAYSIKKWFIKLAK